MSDTSLRNTPSTTRYQGARTGRPPVRAPLGAISTPHYLASAAGLRALQHGGSAVDAIIAANAVLCVGYPHMAGLGGDGFWLVHDPARGGVRALDASGPSARAATREYYREHGVTDKIPSRGPLAALTVPGAVDGWRELHEAHGRLEWATLFDDAIRYARDGMPVARSLADWLVTDTPDLREYEHSARTFLPGNRAPREGERIVMRQLAESFESIQRDGARAGFYEGSLAERFCDALASDGSPLRPEDFAEYRSEWVDTVRTTYRDHEIHEFRPPTQGFAALMVLNLVEEYDLASWGDTSAEYYHHMAEAVKIAFADRDEWLTDPKFVDIPLDRLLSKEYATERRDLVDRESALEMGNVDPGIAFDSSARRERARPAGDTVYLTCVDADGLAVSAIQSIYHDFGSAVVAGDTGIIPQNRGSFFSLDENHPNRLEPGKRTFHTLTPGMALQEGDVRFTFGAMGGEGQPQTHAALVTRLIDFGYDVQQAIEAPRWLMGRTWGAESRDLWLEGRVSDEVVRALKLRGQPVKLLEDWAEDMGHAAVIRVDRENGFLEAGADPRSDGVALGY